MTWRALSISPYLRVSAAAAAAAATRASAASDAALEYPLKYPLSRVIGRFRYIVWVKCPYRIAGKASARRQGECPYGVAGKASALSAWSDKPK